MRKFISYIFIFFFLSVLFIFSNNVSATINSETKVWQTTDSTWDPDIADSNPSKNVYIDSSYTASPRNGTINQPYNSRAEVPKWYGTTPQNKTYLFKRWTTNYWTIEFLNKENINVWAYWVWTRPKIIYTWDSYAINIRFYWNPIMQQASSTRIVGLDVSATKNSDALVRFSSNTTVENCYLHNAQWWIRSTWDPTGSPSAIQNVKLKNSVIEDIADDGMYIVSVSGIVIEDNLIWKVNQNYYLVWTTQQEASWDGIQFVHASNRVVRNNRIDRWDTANKFWFIFALDDTVQWTNAIVEWNTFIAPKWSSQWWSTIYWAIGSGANLLMRNNVFSWSVSLPWYNQTCIWYLWRNLTSSNNVYKNMNRCLTNKFFQNWVPQPPIYSQWDSFIWCNYNTQGNVIVTWIPNENNNPIISNQLFAIFKNDTNWIFVWDVIASDPDSWQSITYSIVWGNTNNAFSINTNWRIVVNNASAINSTTNPFYTLIVRVQDSWSPSLFAEAQIKVVIDSTPLIYPQIFSVNKYTTNWAIIANVVSENPYNSSPLTYSIMWWNTNNIFAITSTWVLYVNNAALIASSSSSSHSISIKVDWDGSLSPNSAWAWMTINVNNNSAPLNMPIVDPIIDKQDPDVIDNQFPITTVSKIYTSNKIKFTIRLSAQDNETIKKTYYKIWYLSWKSGKTFTTTYKKNMLVKFYSVDNDWNKETVKTIQIIKDWSTFKFIEKN